MATRTVERAAVRLWPARVQVGAVPLLAGMVAASFVLRTVLGWLRATPTFFSDEYIYSELGRSIAETGQPLIRGATANFPALLQPVLTAPAWLANDIEVSFRIIQALGSAAMSLAAVPVFLLARRLGLGQGMALALAALALAVPDMLYSSWVVAEPFAYPLLLAAVAAGTAALTAPRKRTQLLFLLLAGLTAFARIQFVVLPLCYAGAVVALGLRERRLRSALREQAFVLVLTALPVLVLAAAGPRRLLGFYGALLDIDVAPAALAKWFSLDAMFLVYVSGWVLVPGALIGLALAFYRPRSRAELAFAALATLVTGALLLEAAVYALGGDRIQERYFFYAAPLVALLFALYATRGWPHRLPHALVLAGLVAVSSRVPLAGFSAADGKTGSPTLHATAWLESRVGDVGLASFIVALAVAALSAALVAAAWRGRARSATAVAIALALAASGTVYAGAVAHSLESAKTIQATVLASNPSFADRAGVGPVALLQTHHTNRGFSAEALFWNRSVDRVYLLPGAALPDAFATTTLSIARDGTLLDGGRAVTIPLLADSFGDTVRFRNEDELASSPVQRLLAGGAPQQLALYAPGRYADGWLAARGEFRLWPEGAASGLAGRLSFELSLPAAGGPVTVELTAPGRATEHVRLAGGGSRRVDLAVCSDGPWGATFAAPLTGSVGSRFVSVHASEPVFTPDPSACR